MKATMPQIPKEPLNHLDEPEQLPMVRWYRPQNLLRIAFHAASSLVVSPRADFRYLEALSGEAVIHDDYAKENELWFDYTADLADGWNPTFAIASLLAREEIPLRRSDGTVCTTHRGQFLVFGGDEAYPIATRDIYRKRLQAPYETASLPGATPHADLFAIPGNHDWYGGLSAFTRLFCQQRTIGNWQTRQTRSYFALRLPNKWWLLGVDIQLQEDIDGPQLEFFKAVAQEMAPGDRVILCTPEPDWIYAALEDPSLAHNLAFLEHRVIPRQKAKVVVTVAGDIHHYRRHESADGSQKITSGGGGAFLHPTHMGDVQHISYRSEIDLDGAEKVELSLKKEYPDRQTSRRIGLRILLFPFNNPLFGLVPGLLYAILGLLTPWTLHHVPFGDFRGAVLEIAHGPIPDRSGLIFILLVFAITYAFSEMSRSLYWRLAVALSHGLAHVVSALLITWSMNRLAVAHLHLAPASLLQLGVAWAGTFTLGYVIGSQIMGIYLWTALSWFDMHPNEAFSSLRFEDYKHFLRFHIDKDGNLTIYPISIDRVPKKWEPSEKVAPGEPGMKPASGHELLPQLIEEPVLIQVDE